MANISSRDSDIALKKQASVEDVADELPTSSRHQDKEEIKRIGKYLISKEGWPLSLAIIAFLFLYQHLILVLPSFWFSSDGYYTHGPLIPLLAAYIIYDRRAELKKAYECRPNLQRSLVWLSAILLVTCAYLAYIASVTDLLTVLSTLFVIATILLTVIFFDYRKAWIALPGLFYMIFAFPIGRGNLDYWTNSLQRYSTSMAVHLLKWMGFHPYQANANQIFIGDYSLYVAAACAGMGLALSVIAFALLFDFIAKLNVVKSVIMIIASLIIVVPINAFRIALIAIVGDKMGDVAAAQFHDWSGYISLIILFLILMKFTRLLGWK